MPADGADDSLARWLVPAVLIGVVAGAGAAALFGLLHLCTGWLLESMAGYRPYRTSVDGGFRTMADSARPWAVPLVAGGGALVATVFALWLAPEARGHGTDAAIAAAHKDPGGMRGRVTVVKLVASALTIGSGGCGGTEGPAAQISAAFGSVIARRTGMSRDQARTALVIGLAAGVGAIFDAPFGGALLGAELLYRRSMDARVLPKAVVAAVAGWLVFGACFGFAPVLGRPDGDIGGAGGLLLVVLVGLAAGAAGRLYTACFYLVHTRVGERARGLPARIAAPTAAAVLVGGLGLLVPGVLGTGYGLMEAVTSRSLLLGMPLAVVLALPAAKIVGTALSVGSGGSGGIFGPCMVVGAGVGAAAWRLTEPLGIAPHSPLVPVAVGMAACLGPVAHAPLGVTVMVAEMLGDASLLGPALLAVLAASAVTGGTTLYRSQPDRIEDEPATPPAAPGPPHQAGPPATPPSAPQRPPLRVPPLPEPGSAPPRDSVAGLSPDPLRVKSPDALRD